MKRLAKVLTVVAIVLSNICYKALDFVTLNVTYSFRTTCDETVSFHYETGFGSGCSENFYQMKDCFETWKYKQNIKDCQLLRTEKVNPLYVYKWLDYLVNPRWHLKYYKVNNYKNGRTK